MTWLSVARVPQDDVGRQLRLVGLGAWALLAIDAGVVLTLAILFGQPTTSTPLGIAAVAALLIAAALIASPSATPLPVWRTVVVVVVVVAVTVIITGQQPFHDRAPGQAAWELGPNNILLFGLALRRRVLAAWIGEAAMVAAVCGWSLLVSGSPLYGLSFSYGQAVSLVAGTVFAVALHRTARRILDFRAAERQRAADEARATASAVSRDAELQLVRDLAEPTLQQIASGANPSPSEVRTLEAALRDLIRGRSLAVEPLVTALRETRERGVDVVVLDDLGDAALTPRELADAVAWSAAELSGIDSGAVTIRLAASGAGALVTVVVEDGARHQLVLPGAVGATVAAREG